MSAILTVFTAQVASLGSGGWIIAKGSAIAKIKCLRISNGILASSLGSITSATLVVCKEKQDRFTNCLKTQDGTGCFLGLLFMPTSGIYSEPWYSINSS